MIRTRVPWTLVAAAAACVAVGAGCQPADVASSAKPAPKQATTSAGPSTPAPLSAATAGTRHVHRRRGTGVVLANGGHVVLPNRLRTPGAVNGAVSQSNVRSTICRTGYTSTVRPSSSYTTGLKVAQLGSGYAFRGDRSTADYEEDHLIALELGGAPASPANLWPEPYGGGDGARAKDRVENQLHDLVCAGTVPLRVAQRAIARNWWRAYQVYGGRAVPVVFNGAYGSSGSATTAVTASSTSSGATARCVDGTLSYSQHRSGTCSHHGGVAEWINPPAS